MQGFIRNGIRYLLCPLYNHHTVAFKVFLIPHFFKVRRSAEAIDIQMIKKGIPSRILVDERESRRHYHITFRNTEPGGDSLSKAGLSGAEFPRQSDTIPSPQTFTQNSADTKGLRRAV